MSGNKFNRQYILRVETETPDGSQQWVEIAYPITLEFSITRNNMASANTATFTIYNLGPQTRARIYKDIWDIDPARMRAVQLFAGYSEFSSDLLPRCFNGTIKRAHSYRSGPDFRTVIEAFDGMVSMGGEKEIPTMPAGTTQKEMITKIATALDGVQAVTLGDKYTQYSNRATAMMGDPAELLKQLSSGEFYIDSQAGYSLAKDEVIDGDIRLINADNGLLGTPKKSEVMVEIDMLFEPRIKPSQLLELQSSTADKFDGVYKVTGIIHRGVISGSICGDCRTSLTLLHLPSYVVKFDNATNEYKAVTSG
jgi:hypothetical protein